MFKKQVIKGNRLRLLEEIAGIQYELVDTDIRMKKAYELMHTIKTLKKELHQIRNDKIMEALRLGVPGKQIGERIGLSKVAIHLIKKKEALS